MFAAPRRLPPAAPGSCPVRKAGKLPWEIEREEYALEYGTDLLEIHRDAIAPGEQVLIVDDVIATGGTAAATARLVERLGGEVVGFAFLIELGVPRRPRRSSRATGSTRCSRMSSAATTRRVGRHPTSTARCGRCSSRVLSATPRRRHALIERGLRGRPRRAPRPGAPLGRPVHRAPARRRDDPRRPRPRRRHARRRAAARRGRGHRRSRSTISSARFGADVAAIVDGVTKLDRLEFDSKEAQQAATMRKMLVAMAKDVRVLLIKLADRLHNMRTIASLPEAKQKRIAQETLDIYAPLAHRLGVQDVKWQLEDLAFAVLYPKRYAEIEAMVLQRAGERERVPRGGARARCAPGSTSCTSTPRCTGRPKHYWSIYEKMVVRGKEFDEINDLVGVRVIVDSVKDCYGALGSIHALWRPVQGRFKDYIAMPKFNLYQSLHTTVVGPEGRAVEFQIRTSEMHRRAEYGVAAHLGYKEQRNPTEDLVWLQRIVDWQQETTDPASSCRA